LFALEQRGLNATPAPDVRPIHFSWAPVLHMFAYDGHTYYNAKFFPSIFFPEKNPLKLLVDSVHPSKFIILAFKKKSIISLVRERNKTGKCP